MLGAFALTIPLLQKGYMSSQARIISISSGTIYSGEQSCANPPNLNSSDLLDEYADEAELPLATLFKLYKRTKALQVVFTMELLERLQKDEQYRNVVVQACHPGMSSTL